MKQNFCAECGAELNEDSRFCPECGSRVEAEKRQNEEEEKKKQEREELEEIERLASEKDLSGLLYTPKSMIARLEAKMEIEGIVWGIVGALQIILGIYYVFQGYQIGKVNEYLAYATGEKMSYSGTWVSIYGIVVIIVGGINLITAKKNLNPEWKVSDPIVEIYAPISGRIAALVVNLLLGSGIGVIGSIFGFVTRGFVMSHRELFKWMTSCLNPNIRKIRS